MEEVWKDVARRTKDFTRDPDRFLIENDLKEFERGKILLKVLYDGAKMATDEETSVVSADILPELMIDDFDEEQVWTGVERQNKAILEECRAKISLMISLKKSSFDSGFIVENREFQEEKDCNNDINDLDFLIPNKHLDELNESDIEEEEIDNIPSSDNDVSDIEKSSDDDEDVLNDPDFQHMSDSDLDDKLPLFDKTDSEDSDMENDDEEKERSMSEEKEAKERETESKTDDYMKNALKAIKSRGSGKTSGVVEDKFFNIEEMEQFLDAEDAKSMKNKSDELDEDNVIDYFASDENFESSEEVETLMYKDYFDSAQGVGNNVSEHENLAKDLLKSESEGENSEKEDLGEMKSSHELRTMRLRKKIKTMEDEAIESKPWQMTGEVAGIDRPENALLEEDLEYDTVSKQAPIITEAVSKRLEDIIMQRIKDEAFDDVARKVKPVENPYDFKKKLILDQEKSKLSLSQVYEEEYLKQKGDIESAKKVPGMLDDDEEKDKPEIIENIKSRMKQLFVQLDTLTHYNYTPQQINAEIKVVRNMPTIAMEEVAPVAMSDATLLAPQEIVDKTREIIGTSERNETDKKRDIRLKKAKQKKKKKSKEQKDKLIAQLNPGLATKYSKKAAEKAIQQAEKEGKVKTIKDKNRAVKSSTAFFDKMQNEVQSIMSDIKADKKNKTKNKKNNAASFKL